MSDTRQVQIRRGTEAEHKTFTGASGEVTFDTTNKVLRLHDGVFAGGHEVALEPDYRRRDIINSHVIIDNYTDGFFTNVSKQMFIAGMREWYWRNQDSSNTYLTKEDWKNGIYVCFTTFLSGTSDAKLNTLTAGVE